MANKEFSVGIVGAGIAGSCAAYFARDELPANTKIVVYEGQRRVGGRIYTATVAGTQVELGAGFFHSTNRILTNLVDALSLERTGPQGREIGNPLPLGVWDGQRFITKISTADRTIKARLVFRYGPSLLLLRQAVKKVLTRWAGLYNLQARGYSFPTPQQLFGAIELFELTQKTTFDFLQQHRVSTNVSEKLCNAISRAIFNQNGGINAFAGVVALAAAGVGGGNILAIRGGNQLLCEAMLKAADVCVQTNRRIVEVRLNPEGTVSVVDANGRSESFDAVLLAVPLETARITIRDLNSSFNAFFPREFLTVFVTCVAGRLRPDFFRVASDAAIPQMVLTTEGEAMPFTNINLVGFSAGYGQPVYKVQSCSELRDNSISQIFKEIRDVLRVTWKAYPVLKPIPDLSSFILGRGLYYINAMESVVSTLETQAIASNNVIKLVKQNYHSLF